MAVPKKKTSKRKSSQRKKAAWKIKVSGFSRCSHCFSVKEPHVMCPVCGYYNDRQVVEV